MNWDKVRRHQPLERWAQENPGMAREYRETGYVETNLLESSWTGARFNDSASPPKSGAFGSGKGARPAKPRGAAFVLCPECHCDVLRKNLERHLKSVHGKGAALPPAMETPTGSPTQKPPMQPIGQAHCPICQARVLQHRLQLHLQKAHRIPPAPVRVGPPNPATKTRPTTAPDPQKHPAQSGDRRSQVAQATTGSEMLVGATVPPDWVKCDSCGVSVLRRNYPKHSRRSHSQGKQTQDRPASLHQPCNQVDDPQRTSTVHPTQKKTRRRAERAGVKAVHVPYEDDPYDAGKFLGYFSREGGRFGSLPLFDDYGDESVP